ncbi:MAG TPA: hypothetical protein VE547_22885 [Mycobacteriales bacterium]|nr:hypothetical protein [Mycobacteriales bacterium]
MSELLRIGRRTDRAAAERREDAAAPTVEARLARVERHNRLLRRSRRRR